MDVLLFIIAAILMVLGLAGCFLPVLPGPPLSYIGLLLIHFTDKVQFSVRELLVWAFLVVLVQVLDYITPLLGTRYSGGGKWGSWGCVIGTLVGVFLFPPWGIIWGPFAGAVIGELTGGKKAEQALKAGAGAFFGFLFSVVIKVTLCGYFFYCFITALF